MPGKIFISYRRDDDPNGAARVRDALAAKFGKANIFMDVDNLLAGLRFDDELAKALAACDVFIAIIGSRWLGLLKAKAASGERDYVCEEIAEALKRKIAVIPVRVGRDGQLAPLPRPDDLSPAIRDLVNYQKHDVAHEHFGRDASALAEAIIAVRRHLRPAGAGAVSVSAKPWLVATAVVLLGIGYVGAYTAGVPVPWPSSPAVQQGPSAIEIAAEKARAEAEERQRVAAAEIEKERQARTKAEAENKRLTDLAEKAQRELDARQKAEAEAKRKAEETERQRVAALKAEVDRQRIAAAEAKRKAEEDAARRDPLLALTPGSGQSARDRLANGQPCPMCPEMVVAPAGNFTMGSPASEPERWDREAQVRVSIARPFAAGKFAVTRGEFAAFVSDTGHKMEGGCYTWNGSSWNQQSDKSWRSPGFEQNDRHPVVCVNWDDAKAYASWLSTKTGKTYRLLSEAEREYVTRAGTTTPFWWGSSITPTQANYNGGFTYAGGAKGEYRQRTVPVDSFRPNPWGLYQVHGNVYDWTEDCWNDTNSGNPGNGTARSSGECGRRVVRGGSWGYGPRNLRSAGRNGVTAVSRDYFLSFRLARTLNP